ncbi:MAG TPA: anaerobic ribonucleoside-triphosphate reductase activating protein [Candidatus Ozemobacteraceae bacterium]|nr:anaerobic ribonucleoside-triphosphate reductase activating protein [Candidatus Ozemobacteraceae bacterium]
MKQTCTDIHVGGLQPFTLIDFPGLMAAVVFLQGCNLRCSYCHNPGLLDVRRPGDITWPEVIEFLEKRRGFLEGVVFSGGEPLMQPGIETAVRRVREMGFEVALHTNGFFPERLEALLFKNLISYIAMDIKSSSDGYRSSFGVDTTDPVVRSARLLAGSGISHEFRTTVHPEIITDGDILRVADMLQGIGCDHFILQKFRPGNVLDPALKESGADWVRAATVRELARRFRHFEVRGDPVFEELARHPKAA